MRRGILVPLAVTATLAAVPSATAKDFRAGDVRVCNASRCVPIVARAVLPRLASFYYRGPAPVGVRRPPLGSPHYELRYRNGYVTGIVATRRLDRFLTYGVHDGRFASHTWYAVPDGVARELRRLTATLRPLRLTRAALARSR